MMWDDLFSSMDDPASRARLLSTATKEAGAWLNLLPVPHLGTKLDKSSLRIAIGLCLDTNCICGALVTHKDTHGLTCKRSGGRISRHQAANETIRRAMVSGGVPAILEPVGLCREDAKRPDGMTLIPWEECCPLLWDFTSYNTRSVTPCQGCKGSGGGCQIRRRDEMPQVHHSYQPICVLSSLYRIAGGLGDGVKLLVRKIGQRVTEITGEPRSTSFLVQRLALDVQRGNAASVLGTLPATRNWSEVLLLP